ncbi:MAG: TMEM165/GDT1 family protein [Alphaproteobacteria bacterium]
MNAFLISAAAIAVAEIGDRTQLLSLMLAARFRRPVPLLAGVILATLANHALAGLAGRWLSDLLSPYILRLVVGVGLIAIAAWTLVPDKMETDVSRVSSRGAFLTALVSFFLTEIGDKTQIATIALAARFDDLVAVVAGTTLGMVAVNLPVIVLGSAFAERLPLRAIRIAAAAVFLALGLATLIQLTAI